MSEADPTWGGLFDADEPEPTPPSLLGLCDAYLEAHDREAAAWLADQDATDEGSYTDYVDALEARQRAWWAIIARVQLDEVSERPNVEALRRELLAAREEAAV